MWIDPPGDFCREPHAPGVVVGFTNFGVSLRLQAVAEMKDRVGRLQRFFETYRSGDEYDTDAITHVMACAAHLPGDRLRPDWSTA